MLAEMTIAKLLSTVITSVIVLLVRECLQKFLLLLRHMCSPKGPLPPQDSERSGRSASGFNRTHARASLLAHHLAASV